MRIQCRTLFDITATGITGHLKPSRMPFVDHAGTKITNTESWNRSRNQQRNWETLTQLISLRTQVNDLILPVKNTNYWTFEFTIDNDNLFVGIDDPLAVLKADCSGVPMLIGLGEQADIESILVVDSNIWFSLIPINN